MIRGVLKCETLHPRPPRARADPSSSGRLASEIVIWKYRVMAADPAPTSSRHTAIGATWFQAGRKPIDAATITPHTTGQRVSGPLRAKPATSRPAAIEP